MTRLALAALVVVRPAEEKAKARALLAEAGFGGGSPLKLELQTRGLPAFLDLASFLATELKRVGIDATVRQVETSQWEPQTIQRKLADAAVSPVLCWRLDYFTVWPHVKNLVPHHSIYGWGRLQDVWLDPSVRLRP